MLVIMGQMRNHLWGSESLSVSAGLINTHFWRDFVGFGSSENQTNAIFSPGSSWRERESRPVIALTLLGPVEVGDLMNTAPEVGLNPRRLLAPLFGLL